MEDGNRDMDGVVEQDVQQLEPLTQDNLAEEIAGLYEDLLNWDHGHFLTDS